MPIYMDLHIAPGVTARDVAEAHLLDVQNQGKYSCKAMTYWVDEEKGCIFCLIEAPDKESVRKLHEVSHGLIPNEIISVNTDAVKAFLGRIQDPDDAILHPETNLKIFRDPAFRIMMVLKIMDRRLLQHDVGKERTNELLLLYSAIIREQALKHEGSELYGSKEGLVVSFTSHTQALDCAVAIAKKLQNTAVVIGLRIALHAGVPVDKSDAIFGTTIGFAQFLCNMSNASQIMMSSAVANLFKDNDWNLVTAQNNTKCLTAAEETFLKSLLDTLNTNWQNPEFDVPDFCKLMSVSKSQLYRKCLSITGMSPNMLLREYRLLQSLDLLRNEDRNVSQTTFDTGFSSPSYFTKCFQKRFGLQPLSYLKSRA